jgi:predicted secreted hydrolase
VLSSDGSVVRLRAEDSGRTVDLTLTAEKSPVLEGDGGLSLKSAQKGNASYYYSFTRLATSGTLIVDGQTLTVKGQSWMDHEFGTAALGPEAEGWDWFSIQLSDRREVMFFQIRNKGGSIEPLSGGTLIEADGTARHLTRDQVVLQTLETWTSSSGGNYPARWNLAIPSEKIDLTIKPFMADQEMRVSIVYWEGAVQVEGRSNGTPLRGSGYVELTGYTNPAQLPH